jgi:hypothetical protein
VQPPLLEAPTVGAGAAVGVTGKVGATGRVAVGPATLMGVEVGTAVDGEPQAASIKARIKVVVIR